MSRDSATYGEHLPIGGMPFGLKLFKGPNPHWEGGRSQYTQTMRRGYRSGSQRPKKSIV